MGLTEVCARDDCAEKQLCAKHFPKANRFWLKPPATPRTSTFQAMLVRLSGRRSTQGCVAKLVLLVLAGSLLTPSLCPLLLERLPPNEGRATPFDKIACPTLGSENTAPAVPPEPVTFWLGNPDKWGPQCESYIADHESADIFGIVEHHLRGDKLAQVSARLRAYHAYTSEAFLTGRSAEGTSAGTMLLVKRSLPSMALDQEVFGEVCPGDGPRRWSAATLRVKGMSVLFVVVYFCTGEAVDSPGNLALFGELEVLCNFFRLPVVLAADFENTPELVERSGWPARMGLTIVKPQGLPYTCTSGSKRLIDFFLLSDALVPLIASCCVHKAPWSTHLCVALALNMHVKGLLSKQLIVPKPLPPFPEFFD